MHERSRNTQRGKARFLIVSGCALVLALGILCVFALFRQERLPKRARRFLDRPVPELLKLDSETLYGMQPKEESLALSRSMISNAAQSGRIRMTAQEQCSLALSQLEVGLCLSAVETNAEAKVYVEECQAILNSIARQGKWSRVR